MMNWDVWNITSYNHSISHALWRIRSSPMTNILAFFLYYPIAGIFHTDKGTDTGPGDAIGEG